MKKLLGFISNNKIKTSIIFFILLVLLSFILSWMAVSGGHDKQNKLILFFKNIIPTPVYQKVRDVVFIVPH